MSDQATPADEYEGRGHFAGGLAGRTIRFAAPHKRLLFLALALFPLVAAAQLAQPYILKTTIDGPISGGDAAGVLPYAGLFVGLVLAQALFQFAQNWIMTLAGQRIMRDLRTQLFAHVSRLSTSYFDRTPLGKVISRLTGDVESLNEFLSNGLVSIVADTILLVGIVGVMFALDVPLTLVSFALVLPLIAVIAWMRGRLRQIFRQLRNRATALNIFLQESIVGMLVIQAFTGEQRNQDQHGEKTDALHDTSLTSLYMSSVLSASVQLAENLTLALLLWVALDGVFGIDATVGLVVAFVDYLARFYAPIEQLSGRYTVLQTALASAEKIFTLLDEDDLLPEPERPEVIRPLETAVRFQNVRFAYATGEEVLKGVDLDVKRGTTVALVGATGAGKSTIVKLLGRFYDPTEGSVTWDGVDLRAFTSRELRKRVAYVPQETFLFSASLGENIALDPETVDEKALRASAEAVGADAIAADLPEGYAQVLGERGHDLSAGERQLVSFARALATDPDVLVLDEATANIDGATEDRIQAALSRLLEGRTAVVIAHRLSTIKQADEIVVLHKGAVRERGTHEELLAQQGLYWTLYRLQSEEAA